MSDTWRQRSYSITFQLHTESKLDRVDLYGSFSATSWTEPIAHLTYAYQKNPGEYVFSETVHLIPGHYEYKYKINGKDWILNHNEKKNKDNNILSKEDFVQLILDRYDVQKMDLQGAPVRYHDVAVNLYTSHLMSDVELIINGNDRYKAHRAILAAGSDYFKAMFQTSTSETTSSTVSLQLADAQVFPLMLKYLYTADMYQIPTLFKAFVHLATERIDANNCLRLLLMDRFLADQWTTVRKKSIEIAASHFLYTCHQSEFVKLPLIVLSDILDHPGILIPNQAILHSALQRWLIQSAQDNLEETSAGIAKYFISDLYKDAIKKCNNVYQVPASIMCFFADGTERYTTMTINAINSFLKSTAHVMVGLLVMNLDTKVLLLGQIDRKYHYRILCKRTSSTPMIKDWNPTQYKLDIIKFSYDGFEEIYWMDSDTATYEDMTSKLHAFRSSPQVFYFILDHVMYDKDFVVRWCEQHPQTFIPQACFMGFKSMIMPSFFSFWTQAWTTWTQPKPFSAYKDPNPSFSGSAFCIEQYALGNAVHKFLAEQVSKAKTGSMGDYITTIDRKLILIASIQTHQEKDSEKRVKLKNMVGLAAQFQSVPRCVPHMYSFIRYTSTSSYNSVNKLLLRDDVQSANGLFIDEFLDCLLHFYNQNYEEGYQWYVDKFS